MNRVINLSVFAVMAIILSKILTHFIYDVKVPDKFEPIVRIKGDNFTKCTGSVISDLLVITAAHCFKDPEPNTSVFTYVSDKDNKETQYNQVYYINRSLDVALVSGDFTKFKKSKLKKLQNGIENDDPVHQSCGFAYGGNLLCFKVKNLISNQFYIQGNGSLYPAMSGGPLYNSNGELVAINNGVTLDKSFYSPLVNFDTMFGVK